MKKTQAMIATLCRGGTRGASCRVLCDVQRKHNNVRDGDNLLCKDNLYGYVDN